MKYITKDQICKMESIGKVIKVKNMKSIYNRFDSLEKKLSVETNSLKIYYKIAVLINNKESIPELDKIIKLILDGRVCVHIYDNSNIIIKVGVDDTLKFISPIERVMHESESYSTTIYEMCTGINKKEVIKFLFIEDEEEIYNLMKCIIDTGVRLLVQYNLKNSETGREAGLSYMLGKVYDSLASVIWEMNSEKGKYIMKKDKYNIEFIEYVDNNMKHLKKHEFIALYAGYATSKKKLSVLYKICAQVVIELIKSELFIYDNGRFKINSDKVTYNYGVNTYNMFFAHPTIEEDIDVRIDKNSNHKLFLVDEHYIEKKYLEGVPYAINTELLDDILSMEEEYFRELLGYDERITGDEMKQLNVQFRVINKEIKNLEKKTNGVDNDKINERDEIKKRRDKANTQLGQNISIKNSLITAVVWSATTEFYIGTFLDYRGRVYYRNQSVGPQSNELGRNLIAFARKEILPPGGKGQKLFNNFGSKFLGLEKKIIKGLQYSISEDELYKKTKKMKFKKDMWREANKKIDYYNWYTHYDIINNGGKTGYICRYDATSSGSQHIAMLTKDDELGAMVNVLLGSEYASDVYSHFAESIRNRLKNLKSSEEEGVNIEKLKALIITRNCVKIVLMTYPYNSTTGGRRQMIENVQFEKESGLYKQIKSGVILNKEEFNLYCNKIDISLKEFNSGLSGFLNTCTAWSSLFSGLNIHLEWLTLCNILTVQHHVELKEVVSHTEIRQQATTYRRYIKTELIDKRRQKSSFAANLIHSLDALHVLKVTLEWSKKYKELAVIHDCFGTHAVNAEALIKVLFEEYRSMYSDTTIIENINGSLRNLLNNQYEVFYDDNIESHYIISDILPQSGYIVSDPAYMGFGHKILLPEFKVKNNAEFIDKFLNSEGIVFAFT